MVGLRLRGVRGQLPHGVRSKNPPGKTRGERKLLGKALDRNTLRSGYTENRKPFPWTGIKARVFLGSVSGSQTPLSRSLTFQGNQRNALDSNRMSDKCCLQECSLDQKLVRNNGQVTVDWLCLLQKNWSVLYLFSQRISPPFGQLPVALEKAIKKTP
ncbi:hypothetical protein DUI87_13519 [Hirundo rustica rustica]|uniref:Uncharacterized protein n=1 Tax=Hirundo rustica rustica TaxID=333673 RepID=A0A3M0K9F0_HIRRU|nr:hypothetical protein DUI87_13519 [Hirundo rustica rustica]